MRFYLSKNTRLSCFLIHFLKSGIRKEVDRITLNTHPLLSVSQPQKGSVSDMSSVLVPVTNLRALSTSLGEQGAGRWFIKILEFPGKCVTMSM
jgi:hypothetical protein